MFKNILVPTDGSEQSRSSARRAIALAKATGAAITGFNVSPLYRYESDCDARPTELMTPADFTAQAEGVAQRNLDAIRRLAQSAGVPFNGHHEIDDFPADAILKAAQKYHCDTIVMPSHRRARSRVSLASQTESVLASAKVPVLVVP